MRLPRPCARCDERFFPSGRATRICDKCKEEATKKRIPTTGRKYLDILDKMKKNLNKDSLKK